MALNPVGACTSFSTSGTSAQSSTISQLTDTLRVVAVTAPVHVAIGTNPTATASNFYVAVNQEASLSIGKARAQKVTGITTGSTTQIFFPEGTGSPFNVGDAVTLTSTDQSYYNFNHKIVTAVDTKSSADGYYSTRITVDANTSGIVTAFNSQSTQLRGSFIVAALSASGTGSVYLQQVQVSSQA